MNKHFFTSAPMPVAAHYSLQDHRIGHGVDGEVFLASSPAGRLCAIKRFNFPHSNQVFQTEVYYSQRLSKCGVGIPHRGAFATAFHGYLVMDLAACDLMSVLEQAPDGFLSPPAAAPYLQRLVLLVESMHHQRMAHLDLKPDNVLITREGEMYLCDFGRAQTWTDSPVHHGSSGLGTVEYAAPERYSTDSFDMMAADIFSLGVIFHVLLTGCFPWKPQRAGQEFPLPLDLINGQRFLGPKGFNLVSKMLDPSPSMRPSIQQIIQDPWMTAISTPQRNSRSACKI